MFHIFETKLTFTHPLEKFSLNYLNETVSERIYSYLKHPTENSSFNESKICPFGKKIIYLLLIYILARSFLKNIINLGFIKILNINVLLFTIILSFSNLNAFIYLVPYYIIEIMMYYFN